MLDSTIIRRENHWLDLNHVWQWSWSEFSIFHDWPSVHRQCRTTRRQFNFASLAQLLQIKTNVNNINSRICLLAHETASHSILAFPLRLPSWVGRGFFSWVSARFSLLVSKDSIPCRSCCWPFSWAITTTNKKYIRIRVKVSGTLNKSKSATSTK